MTSAMNREISFTAQGYTAVMRASSGRRNSEADASQNDDSVPAGLEAAGFQYVAALDIAPDLAARRTAPEATALQFDIPIAPGESSALLLEDADGVLGWRFPDATATGALRRGGGWDDAADHYTITPPSGAEADGGDGTGRRNFITDWLIETVTEPVRVHVVRFLARSTIDAAVSHIESGVARGPVLVEGSDPLAWQVGDISAVKARLPTDRPARVLLLVHGTFSSTAGSFGAMAGGSALAGYDLVLGYDHRTLADDPQTNAEAILAALHSLDLLPGTEIDAIAFSRGGLVYRILVEQMAPKSPLTAHFGKAIFVGCTNGGTLLAEPENWKALLDVYTNALVAGARFGLTLVGAAPVQPFVVLAIKTMGSFAQMLSQAAITDRRVPGLAAMEPDGELVTALNASEPPDGFDTRYFTIGTNYDPSSAATGGFVGRAALTAINRIADRLYGVDNDLVVPTASMSNFGAARQAENSYALPSEAQIYHTIYFTDPDVTSHIAQWLNAGPADGGFSGMEANKSGILADLLPGILPQFNQNGGLAGVLNSEQSSTRGGPAGIDWAAYGIPSPAAYENDQSLFPDAAPDGITEAAESIDSDPASVSAEPSAAPGIIDNYAVPYHEQESTRRGPAGIDWGNESMPSASGSASDQSLLPDAAAGPAAAGGEPSAAVPSITETTERYLAAEMTPYPMLGKPANVYVTVSPDAITVAEHAAAAATTAPIALVRSRKLTLEIIPQSNCEVVGPASDEIDLHVDDEVVTKFRVRGLATGSAELIVEARQGSAPVASFLLKPVFVDAAPAPLRATATISSEAGVQPGRAILRIYEFKANDASVRLQFNLTCDDPQITELYPITIDGGFSLDGYATAVLKQIEDAWNLRQTGSETKIYDSFMQRLVADAIYRTNSLIPEPMRRLLWKYRKSIDAIQVISSEPYIPWELMYLSDPDGEDKERQGFLAEWGLTRWLHDAPLNRHRIPFGSGDLRFVIPEYSDAKTALKGAAEEKTMLKDAFPGIEPIAATSLDVGNFLETGAKNCALLHFACHGRTMQNTVIASDLLMLSQTNAEGKSVPDPLSWQTVYARADFGSGGGPLVFVNACQTGQTGGGIAGAAGFATAFLRPQSKRGAAAFIGALWSVDDKLANDFARTVYEKLGLGESLTAAVKAAREACKTKNDFTWLAYTVYGRA